MLDFLTERYKRSLNLNQNLQFQMPTTLQKRDSYITKMSTGRPQKTNRKRRKDDRDRWFNDTRGEFGKSESTHSRPKHPF